MRAAVDAAFAGYLSALEAKFRSDMASSEGPDDSPERPDYPLFPAGRLVQGKAKVGTTDTLGDSAATAMFHELEKAVGVKPVRGRAWYGIRRVATDLAQDETTDGRALNALTGHSSDATRTKDYQEKERPEVLTLAAKTRRAVRQKAIDVARTAGNGGVS